MTTAGYADAGGVSIAYDDHGGRGTPLVLVHATGFHRRVWDPLLAALSPRFRVVTLDQRGHGRSDKPPSGYEWENFGRDVLAVVDHLGLDRPFAAGHSAGGAALVLAETSRPGTFGRLCLLDPVLPDAAQRPFMTGSANPMAGQARKRRAVWDSREEMITRLRDGSPMRGWRIDFLETYVEHGTHALSDGTFALLCPPEIEAQVYEQNGRHDGWERLADVRCPVAVVFGERSPMWPAARREQCARRVPGGRTAVVAGAGHFFPMEAPDETLRALTGFLASSQDRRNAG